MLESLRNVFASGSFIPHGHCYLWKPELVWLHIASDSLIALAYYSIPITLVYFVGKRQDLPFNWIFLLFGTFIVACGTTHLIEIWTLWHPTYWLSGLVKATTAIVSVYTALELVPLVPKALALPSPAQLEAANQELLHQITERKRAQEALQKANEELEIRVAERTTKLRNANEQLMAEIAERKRVEEEIKKLNENLKGRTVEIEAANKELEAFSYSVSHDLRTPLRAINGFSRILLNEYAPQLAPEARRYLQLVRDNAKQMGCLVDDLLTFSRLGRSPLKPQPVKPTELVRQALTNLHDEQQNRQVEILVGDLPACQADAALLKQVWINLIVNALKFTRQREVARIEVGCQQIDGKHVYFVKDNGVGFNMQYAHKLFGVFQRLHRAEEYEGNGVGLAIVQRVIHRHSGHVWAEAEVNTGSTFYFTLGGNIHHD